MKLCDRWHYVAVAVWLILKYKVCIQVCLNPTPRLQHPILFVSCIIFLCFAFYFRRAMEGRDTVRRNKTLIEDILCADYGLILNKVDEKGLITRREYNNLKSINREDTWGHVVELVDKILNKGDDTCRGFLDLLQTDEDIKSTYPGLRNLQFNTAPLSKPVQTCSADYSGL